jgi:hypothetical protein
VDWADLNQDKHRHPQDERTVTMPSAEGSDVRMGHARE